MKIKAVALLCTRAKQIVLFNEDSGKQWVGDGYAAFLLPPLSVRLSAGALTTIFDIGTEKAADMFIREKEMPKVYDTEDDGEDEEELQWDENSRLIHGGRDLVPLKTPDGKVYTIQAKYLKPVMDCEGLRLTLRRHPGGRPYITAKDGMFVVAVIVPQPLKASARLWLGAIHGNAAQIRDGE